MRVVDTVYDGYVEESDGSVTAVAPPVYVWCDGTPIVLPVWRYDAHGHGRLVWL